MVGGRRCGQCDPEDDGTNWMTTHKRHVLLHQNRMWLRHYLSLLHKLFMKFTVTVKFI